MACRWVKTRESQRCQGIYHLATFQRNTGGGATARPSTRLNQLDASRFLLVRRISRPSHYWLAHPALVRAAVIYKVDGIAVVLSFMRLEERFWFLFTARNSAHGCCRTSCTLRFAMASKKGTKAQKPKGTSLYFFPWRATVLMNAPPAFTGRPSRALI